MKHSRQERQPENWEDPNQLNMGKLREVLSQFGIPCGPDELRAQLFTKYVQLAKLESPSSLEMWTGLKLNEPEPLPASGSLTVHILRIILALFSKPFSCQSKRCDIVRVYNSIRNNVPHSFSLTSVNNVIAIRKKRKLTVQLVPNNRSARSKRLSSRKPRNSPRAVRCPPPGPAPSVRPLKRTAPDQSSRKTRNSSQAVRCPPPLPAPSVRPPKRTAPEIAKTQPRSKRPRIIPSIVIPLSSPLRSQSASGDHSPQSLIPFHVGYSPSPSLAEETASNSVPCDYDGQSTDNSPSVESHSQQLVNPSSPIEDGQGPPVELTPSSVFCNDADALAHPTPSPSMEASLSAELLPSRLEFEDQESPAVEPSSRSIPYNDAITLTCQHQVPSPPEEFDPQIRLTSPPEKSPFLIPDSASKKDAAAPSLASQSSSVGLEAAQSSASERNIIGNDTSDYASHESSSPSHASPSRAAEQEIQRRSQSAHFPSESPTEIPPRRSTRISRSSLRSAPSTSHSSDISSPSQQSAKRASPPNSHIKTKSCVIDRSSQLQRKRRRCTRDDTPEFESKHKRCRANNPEKVCCRSSQTSRRDRPSRVQNRRKKKKLIDRPSFDYIPPVAALSSGSVASAPPQQISDQPRSRDTSAPLTHQWIGKRHMRSESPESPGKGNRRRINNAAAPCTNSIRRSRRRQSRGQKTKDMANAASFVYRPPVQDQAYVDDDSGSAFPSSVHSNAGQTSSYFQSLPTTRGSSNSPLPDEFTETVNHRYFLRSSPSDFGAPTLHHPARGRRLLQSCISVPPTDVQRKKKRRREEFTAESPAKKKRHRRNNTGATCSISIKPTCRSGPLRCQEKDNPTPNNIPYFSASTSTLEIPNSRKRCRRKERAVASSPVHSPREDYRSYFLRSSPLEPAAHPGCLPVGNEVESSGLLIPVTSQSCFTSLKRLRSTSHESTERNVRRVKQKETDIYPSTIRPIRRKRPSQTRDTDASYEPEGFVYKPPLKDYRYVAPSVVQSGLNNLISSENSDAPIVDQQSHHPTFDHNQQSRPPTVTPPPFPAPNDYRDPPIPSSSRFDPLRTYTCGPSVEAWRTSVPPPDHDEIERIMPGCSAFFPKVISELQRISLGIGNLQVAGLTDPTRATQHTSKDKTLAARIRMHVATLLGKGFSAQRREFPPAATEAERVLWKPIPHWQNEMDEDELGSQSSQSDPELDLDLEEQDPSFPYAGGPGHSRASPQTLSIMWRAMRQVRVASFRPDFSQSMNHESNKLLWNLAFSLLLKLCSAGEYNDIDLEIQSEQKIYDALTAHVKYLSRTFREANRMTETAKNAAMARRRRVTRLSNCRKTRVSYLLSQPILAPLIKVVQQCTSDDETDDEWGADSDDDCQDSGSKRVSILNMPWRHPRIQRMMVNLDKLIAIRRSSRVKGSNSGKKLKLPGKTPITRLRSHRAKQSSLKCPHGLPADCYDGEWLKDQHPSFVAQLSIQPGPHLRPIATALAGLL